MCGFLQPVFGGLGVNIKVSSILIASFVLSGCATKYSEVPVAKNFETTEQHVLQAAKHWDLINKKGL